MDNVLRLLLRLMLVPLGCLAGVTAGIMVFLLGASKLGTMALDADAEMQMWTLFGFAMVAPILLPLLLGAMWLPAAIGILISEALAIRSIIFHALNGGMAAWIGWYLLRKADDLPLPLHDPLPIVAAGLAGGLAYWAVAGWSAGFWQPVFRRERPPAGPPSDPATTG